MLKYPALSGLQTIEISDVLRVQNRDALADAMEAAYQDYLLRTAVWDVILPSINAVNKSNCYVTHNGTCYDLPPPCTGCGKCWANCSQNVSIPVTNVSCPVAALEELFLEALLDTPVNPDLIAEALAEWVAFDAVFRSPIATVHGSYVHGLLNKVSCLNPPRGVEYCHPATFTGPLSCIAETLPNATIGLN